MLLHLFIGATNLLYWWALCRCYTNACKPKPIPMYPWRVWTILRRYLTDIGKHMPMYVHTADVGELASFLRHVKIIVVHLQ
jgi:hypothetical protein